MPTPDLSPTATPSAALGRPCANCGAPAGGNFCAQCGQKTDLAPKGAIGFLRDLAARQLSGDGQLRQTLTKLLFAPGDLTAEFAAGRRVRYLRPLQLYLWASLVVFAAVQFFGLDLSLRFAGDHGVHILRSARLPMDEGHAQGLLPTPVQIILDNVDFPGVQRFGAMSAPERFTFLRARRAQYVSYFVLFLVPVLAMTLALLYRSRRRRFLEHLVFGLHCQTFLLLVLLAESELPALAANALSFWGVGYFLLALRRFYGGNWPETLGRGSCVLGLYWAMIFVTNLALVLALMVL